MSDQQSSLITLYDLRYLPITFDFCTFLVLADCYRQLVNKHKLALYILAHEMRMSSPREISTPMPEKIWRINNIFQGVASLLPSVEEVTITYRPLKLDAQVFPPDFPKTFDPDYIPPYLACHVLDLYNQGANPKVLQASEHAVSLVDQLYREDYVTLTLRTSQQQPERNPDMNEWYQFYQYVRSCGLKVIVVPDQEDLLSHRRFKTFDWEVFEGAAINHDLRLALYQHAQMNFGSSNGPCILMFFSNCPVMQFDLLRGARTTRKFWENVNGFPVGDNYPWSAPDQMMIWENSSFETLKAYFDQWSKLAA